MAVHGLIAAGLMLLAAVAPSYAVDYNVGDSSGWASGVDYSTWANDKTFNVGDKLVFQYSMMHTVVEVSSADYSACSASNSIQSYSDQNTKITLTKPGTRYHLRHQRPLRQRHEARRRGLPRGSHHHPSVPAGGTCLYPNHAFGDAIGDHALDVDAGYDDSNAVHNYYIDGQHQRASGNEARFVMGLLAGPVGLVGLALMG